MLRTRLAALAGAAVLGLGLVGPAAFADGTSPTTARPASRPQVTSSGDSFTVTLPGVGSVTFTADRSGNVTGLTATGDPGFTAGTPTTTAEGVRVAFTGSDGQARVLDV